MDPILELMSGMEQHRNGKTRRYYSACLLLTACIAVLSACHTRPPPKPVVNLTTTLTRNGVDYSSVLGCVGSTKAEVVNETYDRQRRLSGYTSIVTCVNSLRSYKLNYSEIAYSGRKKTSYKEEMICAEPKEHHIVFYTDIKYNEEGEVIGYTTSLDGKAYKE